MHMIPAILLFDDGRGDLGPLSDLRASFEQRTAGRSTLERALATGARILTAVPAALAALVAERRGPEAALPADPVLCINGRLHASLDAAELAALAAGSALVAPDGSVVAARLAGAGLAAFT